MKIARVMGSVVATRKHEKLVGTKLLLVRPINASGSEYGETILAIDTVQAGVGEHVLLVLEGRAAISAVRRLSAPVDAAIIGVVDSVSHDYQPYSDSTVEK